MKSHSTGDLSNRINDGFPNLRQPLRREIPTRPASATTSPPLHSQRRQTAAKTLTEKLAAAREGYEVRLPAEDEAKHDQNQARVEQTVKKFKDDFIKERGEFLPGDFRTEIETNIRTILEKANFNPEPYRSKGNGINDYGKYLIYTDDNHNAPFCFQFFQFDAGQKTPIHDHPCGCTSYVVKGTVRERQYRTIDEQLSKKEKIDRMRGSRRAIDLKANYPHSIKNASDDPAGTLHVYRMDGVIQPAAVKKIFSIPKHAKGLKPA